MVTNKQRGFHLLAHERHMACALIALMLGLGIVCMNQGRAPRTEDVAFVSVSVCGAVVEKEVEVPLGATIEEVLSKVELLQAADLSEVDGTKKVKGAERIVIPFEGKKTFFVCGAVQKPQLVVLDGEVTAQKILDNVEVTEQAHVKAFLRRKVFPNGSVIVVR